MAAVEPRTVAHEYTLNWAPILRHLGASLLVSTYQAGKVVVVSPGSSTDEFEIRLSCHNFERINGDRRRAGQTGRRRSVARVDLARRAGHRP